MKTKNIVEQTENGAFEPEDAVEGAANVASEAKNVVEQTDHVE
jgi:predicted transcriptional regulator